MTRVRAIIPNAGMPPRMLRAREQYLGSFARSDTRVSVECIPSGPTSIESHYDSCLAGPLIVDAVRGAQETGFDAAIIYCTNDPAIDAAREVATIPVVAVGDSCLHLATMLGARFSWLTVLKQMVPEVEAFIQASRIASESLASVRSVSISVLELQGDLERTKKAVLREGREAIKVDGAQVLVLGCLGMAGLGGEIQDELGIPVIDPGPVSVCMADLLVHTRLAHSKLAYPFPPRR